MMDMSGYRRLISYIYAYEGDTKGRNVGYARLELRDGQCRIYVGIKRVFTGADDIGVYLLTPESEILIGRLFVRGGAGEFRACVDAANVMESGHSLEECCGLTIHEAENAWQRCTTIWEDAVACAAQVELAEVTAANVRKHADALRERKEISRVAVPSGQPGQDASAILPVSAEIGRELEREEAQTKNTPPWDENAACDPANGPVSPAEAPSPAAGAVSPASPASQTTGVLPAAAPVPGRGRMAEARASSPVRAAVDVAPEPSVPSGVPAAPASFVPPGTLGSGIPSSPAPLPPSAASDSSAFGGAPGKPASPASEATPVPPAPAQPHLVPRAPEPTEPIGDEKKLAELDRADQAEREAVSGRERVWKELQGRCARLKAFDYDYGCEILSIRPQDIGLLPREVWVYGNNSFLLHGYYNHRHLILARLGPAKEKERPRYLLGVPGHYFSSEKAMAAMFGFPRFVLSINQPGKDARFGYWYTDIRL